MIAKQARFIEALEGRRQFIVPIYQRAYSWNAEQRQQLWRDIKRIAGDDRVTSHFVGSLVHIQEGILQVSSASQLLLIDGQQRMTTLILLLAALARTLRTREGNGGLTPELVEDHLFNQRDRDEQRYKLLLTRADRDTLIALLDGKALPTSCSKRIVETHAYFLEQLADPTLDLEGIYHGVLKLAIVDISLKHGEDDPQLIFESLNSTGLDLTQADLIRNFALMNERSAEQTALYNDHWYPMERQFSESGPLDRFVRDYLTLKTRVIPNQNAVYSSFKEFVREQRLADGAVTIRSIVEKLNGFSKLYMRLLEPGSVEPDQAIRAALVRLNALNVAVTYPFLLELLSDYERQTLERHDLLVALRLVESYVLRRSICGVATNTLNHTFSNLAERLDKQRYLESLRAQFALMDGSRRFPTDEEFQRELSIKDLYNSQIKRPFLHALELHNHKEVIPLDGYTIEHILPQNQNLSLEWQHDLGTDWQGVQARHLHTLGNLTLTGYNSELSDKPFREKRDMTGGFRDSHLRLNHALTELEQWNEAAILERGAVLVKVAVTVWPYPPVTAESLDAQRAKLESPRSNNRNATAEQLSAAQALFRGLREQIPELGEGIVAKTGISLDRYFTASGTEFATVVPATRQGLVTLRLNALFDELDNPTNLGGIDLRRDPAFGRGSFEVELFNPSALEPALELIRQAWRRQSLEAVRS